jgi:hypothetical protein
MILMLLGACHHDPAPAAPADPADKPPLPPASGTPIGFIIDDAGDLKLRDDQVAKLREIDTSLAARLEVIDSQTRAANKPAEEAASPAPSGGRHGGRRGGMGGMGGGGMGGGGPSGGSSGGHHRRGGGAGSGSGAPSNAAMVSKLVDERTADVKDALERAFALLDPAQQVGAKKVLTDHDVDVDINVGPPMLPPPSQSGQMGQTGESGASGGDADPPPEP